MTFMLMSTPSRQMAHTISSTGLTKDELAKTEVAVADILQLISGFSFSFS
jgi:hypothetical protein